MQAQRIKSRVDDATTQSLVEELKVTFERFAVASVEELREAAATYSEGKDRLAYIQRHCDWTEFTGSRTGAQALEGLHLGLMAYWRLVGLRASKVSKETLDAASEAWGIFQAGAGRLFEHASEYAASRSPALPKLADDRIDVLAT